MRRAGPPRPGPRRFLALLWATAIGYLAFGEPGPPVVSARAEKAEPAPAPAKAPAGKAPEPRPTIPSQAASSAAPPSSGPACPPEMVLVEGQACTEVEHTCERWLDDPKLPFARCATYRSPARCTGERVELRFCIDRLELGRPGSELPENHLSLIKAQAACKAEDKRLCTEREWTFACEGPEMLPYPYGWSRSRVCNHDLPDLYEMKDGHQVLKDLRRRAGADPACRSPFGVLDMAGNLDEPTLREGPGVQYPFRTALKGGWWMAARNRCRPATTAHDDHYEGIQVGARCCKTAAEGQ